MSRRKHLLQSLTQEIKPPSEGQHIVRAVGSRGSNIIEVEYPDGRATLCLLPARFHKKLWIKKGTYLIIEDLYETEAEAPNARVTGQISAVLYADHVKQLGKMPGVWPPEFEARSSSWPVSASQAAEQLALLGLAEGGSKVEAAGGSGGGAAAGVGAVTAAAAAAQQAQPAAADGGGGEQDQLAAAGAAGSAAAGEAAGAAEGDEEGCSSSEDDLPPIPRFQNRKYIEYEVSESESE